jgi:DNA-binding transcriptional ArsR family regulator
MNPQTLDIETMRAAAGEATKLLRTLANPDRMLLLCQLSQGETSVGELEVMLGIVQPTRSQQLCVLRQEKIVSTRRAGKQIFYSVKNPKALVVLNQLYALYCGDNREH